MNDKNNDKKQEPKICPLLLTNPEETSIDCLGPTCAWFIQNRPPAKGGCCAIACLAGIGM